ncbi:Asp23/Gls24 family envelope stress response protein [Spongiactinospora sp. TRM90649]|uniref:Asp23/Gls24 family envelope stress response protein n=1 Tax=Spongiactinospora sp. TRM90649 TaxID=3031114 RepID=UPI0023F8DE11|nr:Asp23/Gls24 family envelope stress response protein [Spongiactinospora sp. TRM90649]MDF5753366.1 Asp23/Gls24 family envelope stress response protein [Spongiactinospora sp. TRM90649]
MTQTATARTTRTSATPATDVPPERRGRTIIPEAVVARIAAGAAREVEGVLDVRRRGVVPWNERSRADVDGGLAMLSLDVSVAYPAPLRTLTDRIRNHVAARVHYLTGLAVGHVDIEVTSMVPGQRPARTTELAEGARR